MIKCKTAVSANLRTDSLALAREAVIRERFLLLAALSLLVGVALGQETRTAPFVRGDANGDGNVDGSDALTTAHVLFLGEATTTCDDALDANDDGEVDVSDPIRTLIFRFRGGGFSSPLPSPGFECLTEGDGRTCAETVVFVPGYDLTTDDPFACGDAIVVGGNRPVAVHQPPSYDPEVPTPLVLALHGATSSGGWYEHYRNYRSLADSRGFLYAHPNAQLLRFGGVSVRIWNATDACCAFGQTALDDSEYLRSVIEEIKQHFNVDQKRVFLIGRSNGGFMANRMACDHADILAAIVSIAGATYLEPANCNPPSPIHMLQIHGTADDSILFGGGRVLNNSPFYPGAVETVEQWATHNGCSLEVEEAPPLDLEADIPGAETVVTRYVTECSAGGSAELWTILGGGHNPALLAPFGPFPTAGDPVFTTAIIDWLFAHPKP